MEKRVLYKFIFLLIVALLIIAVYVWKWTADEEQEQQNPQDLFDESQQETEQPPELKEDQIDDVLEADRDSNAADETTQNATQQTTEDQHETTYQKQFGDQAVTSAKEQAQEGLALYLSQITDWEKWDGVVTTSFLKEIKQVMPAVREANVERSIESIELFASDATQKNNMTFGAFASWPVTSNGRLTNQRTQLFYLTMVQQNNQWLVN